MRLEIIPGEGGDDAALFASELASAVARASGRTAERAGTTLVLHRL